MNTRTHIRALLAAALLAASGCGADSAASAETLGVSACSSDSECGGELTCRDLRCTVPEADDRDLSFMFIPPSSSPFLPQRTPYYQLNPGERLDFALEPSVAAYGQVGSFNVDGTLVFTPAGSADPLLRQQAAVTRGDYEVALVPGTYNIDFVSSTNGVPNRIWRDQPFQSNLQYDLPLPDLSQTVSITGNVNFRDPTVDVGAGLGPARVTAVSRDTGALSTSVVTDPVSGFYEGLRVWRDTGVYDVVVSSNSDDALIPTVTFRGAIDTDAIPANASTYEANLFVGDFAAAERNVRLELDEAAEAALEGISPADLDVNLVARLDTGSGDVEASFSLRGSIASSGDESSTPLRALPLRYVGEIVPPPGSRYARTPIEIDLSSISARVVKIQAPTPLELSSATVLAYTGQPAANARVTFTPRSRRPNTSQAKSVEGSRAFEVTTNDDGELGVWLEPEVDYDVRVDPMTQDAPRATYSITGGELPPTLSLPSPSLLSGSVFANDATGASIPDVTVRVLERDDGIERVIAEGQTDDAGAFRLIAPDDADD
jgi:hypothetical protein